MTSCAIGPQGLAVLPTAAIEGVERTISGVDIDHAIRHGWRGGDAITGGIGPERLASLPAAGVKGVQLMIQGTDIQDAIRYGW
jgi:hypothetical protein